MSADDLRAALRCGRPGCDCQRGPRRTHCPAHPDVRPSLDIDERGGRTLVICRSGCTQRVVLTALRARGLWATNAPATQQSGRTPREEAHGTALRDAQAQRWARPGVLDLYTASDFIRSRLRLADRHRDAATRAGESPESWGALEAAAGFERQALALEAELEEVWS